MSEIKFTGLYNSIGLEKEHIIYSGLNFKNYLEVYEMEKNSFICIDLGASNTRYCCDDGVIHWMPNNVAEIQPETNTRIDLWETDNLQEKIYQHLDLTIEKVDGATDFFPARVLIGKVADRYTSVSEKPSGMENKHTQKVNYINAIAATAISRWDSESVEDVYMYLALPPVEARSAYDYVSEQFCGEFKVTFNMLNKTVRFKIVQLSCMEESYAALTTFFFANGKMTDKARTYGRGNVLSLDIGASTTDLAATQNMQYFERTGKTIKIGGNVVRDYVIDEVMAQKNIDLNIEGAELAVAEGRVQAGMAFIDVGDIVASAKRAFAEQIVNNMQTYFKNINIPIQNFMAIVVSGGGSMAGKYYDMDGTEHKTSESMAYYITERLKKVCSTVAVEYIDDNPRMANIKGLVHKAIFDKAKREREAAQA